MNGTAMRRCSRPTVSMTNIEAIRKAPMDEMIVFLVHGTSTGLLDTSGSIGDHMIDDNDARVLKGHQNVICMWCYASEDARYNKHQGFYTGMFLL